MEEIIQKLMEKTGLPQDKAGVAVTLVISMLKDRLPAPLAAQLDSFVAGGAGSAGSGDVAGMAQGLGSMLGKK